MEHQQAIERLKDLLNRPSLDTEEKDALITAIGVLSWATLSKSRIKSLKAKRDKATEL